VRRSLSRSTQLGAEAPSYVTRICCRVGVAFFDHVALNSRLARGAELFGLQSIEFNFGERGIRE